MGFVLRSLVLVTSLVLALPPGWCNFVPSQKSGKSEETPKKAHGGCCDLCHCQDREKPPPQHDKPIPLTRCCCYELDWLKPSPPEEIDSDPVLSVPLIIVDAHPSCFCVGVAADLTLPIPSPPLHVLKCVWLC